MDSSTTRHAHCAPGCCHPNRERIDLEGEVLQSIAVRNRVSSRTSCNLMWAYQPRSTRQSASLCVKEPPLTQSCDVRPCDGVWQHSHHLVVSDSQLFLTTLSHGQAEGLLNDVCESRRHDVRLQVQFVEENLPVAELVQREFGTVVPIEEVRPTCLDLCVASATASSWYFPPLKCTSMRTSPLG